MWHDAEGNDDAMRKLRHVIDLLSQHEYSEGTFTENVAIMTHLGCPLNEKTMSVGYESQESYRNLRLNGSLEVFFEN